MPKNTLAQRIARADELAGRYLGNYNELIESGVAENDPRAEKLFGKAQFWLDRYNLLINDGDRPAPKR